MVVKRFGPQYLLSAIIPLLAILSATAAQMDVKWTTLFDGKSLDGWTQAGDANWHLVKDPGGDYVQAEKGTGFLVTPKSYDNFTLKVEWWADTPANSGVFIRIQDPKAIGADNAYEFKDRKSTRLNSSH